MIKQDNLTPIKASSTGPRKIDKPKATLEDILNSVTALDEDTVKKIEEAQFTTPVSYDEWVPNEVAKSMLGADYDPSCKYKVVTQRDETVVVKVDTSLPEDFKTVYDNHGNVVRAYMTEYILEETDDMQESYSDMMSNITQRMSPGDSLWKVHKKRKQLNWTAIVLSAVFVISLILWIGCYIIIHRLGGV